MMRVSAILVLLALLACSTSDQSAKQPPNAMTDVEAISLFGTPLSRPALPPETVREREAKLAAARSSWRRNPNDAEAIIWLGRRTAYLGRYREAIEIFTQGIEIHPNDARFYLH